VRPRITARWRLAALRRGGWVVARQAGSHVVVTRPERHGPVVVPIHGKSILTGTRAGIL
jgi:predicted RNA binding protein YcfA (HicA-like mRNA interferase family)